MYYDVFISYSRKDYIDENKVVIPDNIIDKIKKKFDENGITYWFDEDGVYSGDAFAPIIARNIKSSKVFLFISSAHSNASEWTSNEIATAHAFKKKIIPFKYDDSVYNDSVILYIARLDYIEYWVNPQKSIDRLLSSVQSYLNNLAQQERLQQEEKERKRLNEELLREQMSKRQALNDKIKNLVSRKIEIDREIVAQEEALAQLRNEKRIVDTNIDELQHELAMITGIKPELEPYLNTSQPKIAPHTDTLQPDYNKSLSWFNKEKLLLKLAWSNKHWLVNWSYSLYIIICVFYIFLICSIEDFEDPSIPVCVAGIMGSYNILKNNRIGVVWLLLLLLYPFLDGNLYTFFYISIPALILLCLLFIKKRDVIAWKYLSTEVSISERIFNIFSILLTILWIGVLYHLI